MWWFSASSPSLKATVQWVGLFHKREWQFLGRLEDSIMKILLVEDDMEIGAMLKSFLTTENYEWLLRQTGRSPARSSFPMILIWFCWIWWTKMLWTSISAGWGRKSRTIPVIPDTLLPYGGLGIRQEIYNMSDQIILFLLLIVIAVLAFVVLYQRFAFRRGIRIQLIQISRKLEDIAESDSDEKVMVLYPMI